MATDRKAFKDWFDADLVDDIAQRLSDKVSGFDRKVFHESANRGLQRLEMMDRVRQIAHAMDRAMPAGTEERMRGLIASMGAAAEMDEGVMDRGYVYWPYGEFIGATGLDDWDASFEAMIELTKRLTSEFAIRPFLEADIHESMKRLDSLVEHPNAHVRRWTSEGTRTRLPWASAVPALHDVLEARIGILERLKDDTERYVRRSVANHLQDILKDEEVRGIEVLKGWFTIDEPGVAWVCKHASRGLLKQGNPQVLALFGYEPGGIQVDSFKAHRSSYEIGETMTLHCALTNRSKRSRMVRVDWVLDRPTPAGNRSTKVLRWADRELKPGESSVLTTTFSLIHRSTRRLAAGSHELSLRVNGEDLATATFSLQGVD